MKLTLRRTSVCLAFLVSCIFSCDSCVSWFDFFAQPRGREAGGEKPNHETHESHEKDTKQEASKLKHLLKNREILFPNSNLDLISHCHDRNDLTNMIKIVNYPGREKLSQRHLPELGMHAFEIELIFGQVP